MSKIEKTTNYSMFKFLGENRGIDRNHVKQLCKSISTQNHLPSFPIIVDRDMNVIDGQHRLKAAEKLEIPIYYSVLEDADMDTIIIINNCSRKWKYMEYVNHYAKRGYPDYIKLRDYLNKHNIPIGVALKSLGMTDAKIRTGNYKYFSSQDEAVLTEAIENSKLVVEDIEQYSFDPKKAIIVKLEKFYLPLVTFLSRGDVDFEYFRKNLRILMHMITLKNNKESYYNLFLHIYNYSKRNRIE